MCGQRRRIDVYAMPCPRSAPSTRAGVGNDFELTYLQVDMAGCNIFVRKRSSRQFFFCSSVLLISLNWGGAFPALCVCAVPQLRLDVSASKAPSVR